MPVTKRDMNAVAAAVAIKAVQDAARQAAVQEIGDAIVDALAKLGYTPAKSSFGVNVPAKVRKQVKFTIRPGTDVARVVDVIKRFPGRKGHELIVHLAGSVKERTMRTALRRLRVRGFIEQGEDGGWYTKGDTKIDQPSLKLG